MTCAVTLVHEDERRGHVQQVAKDIGRVTYTFCEDKDALTGFDALARNEGILPALESSHAIFRAMEQARKMPKDQHIVVCLSGRGDKDAAEIARLKAAH